MGRGRRGSGGAGRGRKQTSTAPIPTRSSKRIQERDEACSKSGAAVAGVSVVGDHPTASRSRGSAAVKGIESGNDGAVQGTSKITEVAESTIKSETGRKSRSRAETPASPPEPRGAQEQEPGIRITRRSAAVVKDSVPERKSRSSLGVGSASRSTSMKAIVSNVGSSRKRLTRAEEIQLEADRIPSVKTSTWNPFSLFPQEIWEVIFGYLTDSKDHENVMNATPEWRKMYLPKRVNLLFQQAIAIMAKDKSYLKKKEYFPCRLVCNSWDQSVQNFIQLHPVHFDMICFKEDEISRGISKKHKYQSWQKTTFWWFCEEQIQQFLDDFAETHPSDRNPFLCRTIVLQDTGRVGPRGSRAPDNAISQGWRSIVANLLEKYGSHVWDFSIEYSWWTLTPVAWHINILHWISLMQNLKVLNLDYLTCLRDTESDQRIQHSERVALENHIGISPLPEQKDLIFLKTRNVPVPLFNELIKKATSLQKLEVRLIRGEASTKLSHYQLNTLVSQNLTECQLTLLCPEDFAHLELESRESSWPLKKLCLELVYPSAEWDHIFKVIEEKFDATLLELILRLPKATNAEDERKILNKSPNYRLKLSNVKSFRVTVPNLTSFDFLLPMKSLDWLSIVVDHQESNGRNAKLLKGKEALKFTDNFHRLFETNVWEKLPKLKNVKLSILENPAVGYSRNEYTVHDYDKKTMKHTKVSPRIKYSGFESDEISFESD